MTSSSSDPKVNTTALQSLISTYPKTKPITMLNLIRFRPTAIYSSETSLPVCTGSEAYQDRYLPAVRPILAEIGAEIVSVGKAWVSERPRSWSYRYSDRGRWVLC